jgi:hypothetical protein
MNLMWQFILQSQCLDYISSRDNMAHDRGIRQLISRNLPGGTEENLDQVNRGPDRRSNQAFPG